MRHSCLSVFLATALLLAGVIVMPCRGEGGMLTGRVTDMASEEPIAEAVIRARTLTTTTDSDGQFQLALSPGEYDIHVRAPGYIAMIYGALSLGSAPAHLDLEMVPANPTAEAAAAIEAKLLHAQQALPDDIGPPDEDRGYALSGIDQVPATIRVLMPDDSVVVMQMDEYLKGVVPHEVPPYWPGEALRAQAVAARSYAATRHAHGAVGADVCTTTHCQVWSGIHYETTDRAVDDTHGQVATFDGQIIHAFFFGHCDGHTRDIETVWGGYLPYCRSVACPCGYDKLFGHGVGLCQQGARVLAEQGMLYGDILRRYYTGIEVSQASPGRITGAIVFPLSGDEETEFTYEATYASEIDDPPAVANVLINGHARALLRVESGTVADDVYRLTTRLSPGEHTFRFYFDDGYGHVSTVPVRGTFAGPHVEPAVPVLPTPPPIPTPAPPAHAELYVYSTVADWASGEHIGTHLIDVGDGALSLDPGRTAGSHTSEPISTSLRFMAVGIIAYGDATWERDVEFSIRSSVDGLAWGDWIPCRAAEDIPAGHRQWRSDLIAAEGQAVQYRVELLAAPGEPPPVLENIKLVCIDGTFGVSAVELGNRPRGEPGEGPNVVSREEWWGDSLPGALNPELREPRVVILHHTGAPLQGIDPAAMVRATYYYQSVIVEQGDIGYNYLIDHLGNIYEGRAGGRGVVGRHAGRYDWGSIGIALVGGFDVEPLSPAMLASLADLLAWICVEDLIDVNGQTEFVDTVMSTIMGHRGCGGISCPGDAAYAQIPDIRNATLAVMAHMPPNIELASPLTGSHVRAVTTVGLGASPVITRIEYYVDGILRQASEGRELAWKWNTVHEDEAEHTLRVVAYNAAGSAQAEATVVVDNTPPQGSATGPAWSRSLDIELSFGETDAIGVQLSDDWVWEGEELAHTPETGGIVADPRALNGLALRGRAGADQPGAWYGPYTCNLSSWREYDVYFRLRTPAVTATQGIATIDVADNRGQRVYATQPLCGLDFAHSYDYEEFRLPLDYESAWPTCQGGQIEDGLEFRTWFSGLADLYLDRVAVYETLMTPTAEVKWRLRPEEGQQRVFVRFVDLAGNAHEQVLVVGLDTLPPDWESVGAGSAMVQDPVSGLDTSSARYATSTDGGLRWSQWIPLDITATRGVTLPVVVAAPPQPGGLVRFRMMDVAGNESESAAINVQPTATPTVEPTLPPLAAHLTLPLILK